MPSRLGDPVRTHLVRQPQEPAKPLPPSPEPVRWAEGKVLVVSLVGVLWRKPAEVEKRIKEPLAQAHGGVVDVRDESVSESQLSVFREGIGGLRAAGAPRMLYVEHRGYRTQVGGGSGGYDTFLIAREPDVLRVLPERTAIPVTFIVRPTLGVLPAALA